MTPGASPRLAQGTWISGKWTRHRWRVRQCLGEGANGTVYSVVRDDGLIGAMKVCEGSAQVAFEWSLLERVKGAAGSPFPVPQTIDDSDDPRASYFYVMERVGGSPLNGVWSQLSLRDQKKVFYDIVRSLESVHRTGHAFCDVKPQNILVDTSRGLQVRFVDVGGVTPFGRAVRQFTPTSDPAYWGFAERRASCTYDVAAIALTILLLENAVPKNLAAWPMQKRKEWMKRLVDNVAEGSWRATYHKALSGAYPDAGSFAEDILRLSDGTRVKGAKRDWTAKLMWASLASACFSTAWAWALFFHVV